MVLQLWVRVRWESCEWAGWLLVSPLFLYPLAFRPPTKIVLWFVRCPTFDPSKISDPPNFWCVFGKPFPVSRGNHSFQKLKSPRHSIQLWKNEDFSTKFTERTLLLITQIWLRTKSETNLSVSRMLELNYVWNEKFTMRYCECAAYVWI